MEALLDACAVGYLFDSGQKEILCAAARISRIHLVNVVVAELEKPRERGWGDGFKKMKNELVELGQCEVHELITGTQEERLFQSFRREHDARQTKRSKKLPKNQGELASIALAVGRPEFVFVTEDRGALTFAIDELPGFVVRTAAWIRAVHKLGAEFDKAGLESWAKRVPGPLPCWWEGWLDGNVPNAS